MPRSEAGGRRKCCGGATGHRPPIADPTGKKMALLAVVPRSPFPVSTSLLPEQPRDHCPPFSGRPDMGPTGKRGGFGGFRAR
eukprot:911594-Prymnesium_polylepis.1